MWDILEENQTVPKRDYYEIMGVSRLASAEEIRSAHRALVRRYHPDAADDGHGDLGRFTLIQEAYAVLSNGDQRRRYDYKHAVAHGQAPRPGPARPRKSPCAACGTPVYSSQLKLYVGRLICQSCHSSKQQRGPQVQLSRSFEMRLRMARLWAQWQFAAILLALLCGAGVGARIAWTHGGHHHNGAALTAHQNDPAPATAPSDPAADAPVQREAGAGYPTRSTESADVAPVEGNGKD